MSNTTSFPINDDNYRASIKSITFFILLVFTINNSLQAQKSLKDTSLYRHSVGYGFGVFSHYSYKTFVFEDVALEASYGSFPGPREGLYGSISLTHHSRNKQANTYKYFGGGIIADRENFLKRTGLMFPLGLEVINKRLRLNIFTEVCPTLFYENKSNGLTFSSFIRREPIVVVIFKLGGRIILFR